MQSILQTNGTFFATGILAGVIKVVDVGHLLIWLGGIAELYLNIDTGGTGVIQIWTPRALGGKSRGSQKKALMDSK